jgi:carbamoyl-phosphate synthase large subunit
MASNSQLPRSGTVFVSVRHGDKDAVVPVAKKLEELGYGILATRGTAARLKESGIACSEVNKISQGRPHILDKIQDGQVQWILNTSAGTRTTEDSYIIRRAALDYHIPYTTTITGGQAMTLAMTSVRHKDVGVKTIQEFAKFID